ncbi:MAG: twin-arginine translocase TatA/TatE family subunit [Dethiobacteria bacterium]
MGRIGIQELILILALALIIFGPRKLPEIGRSIGQGLREFKKATTEMQKSVSLEATEEVKETGNVLESKPVETKPAVEGKVGSEVEQA